MSDCMRTRSYPYSCGELDRFSRVSRVRTAPWVLQKGNWRAREMSPDGLIGRQGVGISGGRVGERRGAEPDHDMEILP